MAEHDIFFFDSFGLDGLKHFIIQDDRQVIEKILFEIEQMTRTDNKITLFNIRFNLNGYKNLYKKGIDALSDTAKNVFHFIKAFDNKLKRRNFLNKWIVEDGVQDLNSATCGIFQFYFYDNLLNPNENSKTQDQPRLNKKTIETLLNELFGLNNQETNDAAIRQYASDSIMILA